ncbi:unnamed protein product [Psylliodes chrysocephalus]|uniref:Uncharacterized protein n=1 Tax=Psylliodes chrysocephalus TaxID=3402493 RepID=A0A9P0GF99_9CUCU|nr:unnamed protein product [Psylliodes chrysocephala]
MVKFGRESPTEMVLCLNHTIHLSVLATFCDKNETSQDDAVETNIPTIQASEMNIFREESNDDDDLSIEDYDLTRNVQLYTPNIDEVLLFQKNPFKNITLQNIQKKS